MKKFIALLFTLNMAFAHELLNLDNRLYEGVLSINDKLTSQSCYLQINDVESVDFVGKNCHRLEVQLLSNLNADIYDRFHSVTIQSRITNTEAEFHRPKTCSEIVPGVVNQQLVNKWGDDYSQLYLQVFSNEEKYKHGQNHYIVIFSGVTKEPSRAMLHRVTWFSENSYECINLKRAQ